MTDTVSCVACCYDLSPGQFYEKIDRIAKRIGVNLRGVLVVNRPIVDRSAPVGWRSVQGSDVLMDMSAYYEGIQASKQDGSPNEPLLVLNDTVFTTHNAYWNIREAVKYRSFAGAIDLPCIVGRADRYTSICFQNPWSGFNEFISSFCMLFNPSGARVYEEIYERLPQEFPPQACPVSDPAWGLEIDPRFRNFLKLHLTTDYDPNSWYRAKRYARKPEVLEMKAHQVYLEHRLSGAIGANGIVIATNASAKAKVRYFVKEQMAKLNRKLLG